MENKPIFIQTTLRELKELEAVLIACHKYVAANAVAPPVSSNGLDLDVRILNILLNHPHRSNST